MNPSLRRLIYDMMKGKTIMLKNNNSKRKGIRFYDIEEKKLYTISKKSLEEADRKAAKCVNYIFYSVIGFFVLESLYMVTR